MYIYSITAHPFTVFNNLSHSAAITSLNLLPDWYEHSIIFTNNNAANLHLRIY